MRTSKKLKMSIVDFFMLHAAMSMAISQCIDKVHFSVFSDISFRVQDNIVEDENQVDENVELNPYFAEGFADCIVVQYMPYVALWTAVVKGKGSRMHLTRIISECRSTYWFLNEILCLLCLFESNIC
jgi:hypothetical protein